MDTQGNNPLRPRGPARRETGRLLRPAAGALVVLGLIMSALGPGRRPVLAAPSRALAAASARAAASDTTGGTAGDGTGEPASDADAIAAATLPPLLVLAAQDTLASATSLRDQALATAETARVVRAEAQVRLDDARSALAQALVATYQAGAPSWNPTSAQRSKSAYLAAASSTRQRRVETVQGELHKAAREEAAANARVEAAQAAYQAALSAYEAARAQNELTILGPSFISAKDLAAWADANAPSGWVVGLSPGELARLYIREGAAEGVRGDIAFAQAILETGFFTSPLAARSNFAGIGACDSCPDGNHYGEVLTGVRAQIQLLRTYATASLSSEDLAHPPVLDTPEGSPVRGCCPYWRQLTGVWASSPVYDAKVFGIYLRIAQWVLSSAAR